ncbi:MULTISPECIES: WD40 repeat domain-containing protein [unclassified Streptomyces]|uniref:WD40 repeat domain-containing protein n=1 Tax=unclassified Streptomyces TaxID=2593676 RepID=UPI0035E0DAD5
MSAHDVARRLPDVPTLRNLCRSIAMLDAILDPDPVGEPRHRFDARWQGTQGLASMDNGAGDAYRIVFSEAGAYVQGFDHESPMSPYDRVDGSPWPGVLDPVPGAFQPYVRQLAFDGDGWARVTACLWRETGDEPWHVGSVEVPGGMHDADGADWLFQLLADGTPQEYQNWAEGYYGRPVELSAVHHLYALRPLTPEVVSALNPAVTPERLRERVEMTGYPQDGPVEAEEALRQAWTGALPGHRLDDGEAHPSTLDADDGMSDPRFLVMEDPARVMALSDRSVSSRARLASAVYRASAHLHRDAGPATRRQLLALDAARYGDRNLSAQISAVPVPDEPAGGWRVDWAVGHQVDSRFRHPFTGHTGAVLAAATVGVGGRSLAVTSSSDVRVWDVATGRQLGDPFTGHVGPVRAVAAVVVEGRPIAVTGDGEGVVRIWDLTTHEQINQFPTGHTHGVRAVAAMAVDGRPVVVTGGSDRTARAWDANTGQPLCAPLGDLEGEVVSVAMAVLDGRPVAITATGGHGSSAVVWDLVSGEQAGVLHTDRCSSGPSAVATAVLDGRPVAVTSEYRTVRVWDLATRQLVGRPLTGHTRDVTVIATIDVAGRPSAVTGGNDGTVRIWDLAKATQVGTPLITHRSALYTLAASIVDGRPTAVTGSGDDRLARVWDLAIAPGVKAPPPRRISALVHPLATLLEGRVVVLTCDEHDEEAMRVSDVATGEPVGRPCSVSTTPVAQATTVLNGRPVVITADSDGVLRVQSLETWEPVGRPIVTGDGSVNQLITAVLDGRPVVLADCDRSVRVYDPATGQPMCEPLAAGEAAVAVLDGRPVVVICADKTGRTWDLATGQPIGEQFAGHPRAVNAVATAVLDGRPVAVTGSVDATARVWDLASGRQVGEPFAGHTRGVLAVATGVLDGRTVAVTGSADATVRVWDLAAGQQIGPPLVFPSPVHAVTVAPDGRLVAGFGSEAAVLSPR